MVVSNNLDSHDVTDVPDVHDVHDTVVGIDTIGYTGCDDSAWL